MKRQSILSAGVVLVTCTSSVFGGLSGDAVAGQSPTVTASLAHVFPNRGSPLVAVSSPALEELRRGGATMVEPAEKNPPPARPYVRRSLANASDEEVLRLMGTGRESLDFWREQEITNQLPPGFWTMEPRKAALSLVELNRSEAHRAVIELSIEDTGAEAPPAICTLTLLEWPTVCGGMAHWHFFIRVDPAGSYLAYGVSGAEDSAFQSFIRGRPWYDLRYCPLSYSDAHQLSSTIWWLDRVRSRDPSGKIYAEPALFAEVGSNAVVEFHNEKGVSLFSKRGKSWRDSALSSLFRGQYDSKAEVGFIFYLIRDVLTKRLGDMWTQAGPPKAGERATRFGRVPVYTVGPLRQVTAVTGRFLGLYSESKDNFPEALALIAVRTAGSFLLTDAKPVLERIQHADNSDKLNDAISTALRKLETADDPAALYDWATSMTDGGQWAMHRLAAVDAQRHRQALEKWFKNAETWWAYSYYEEIREIDPAFAAELARRYPVPVRDENYRITMIAPNTPVEMTALERAKNIKKDNARVAALLAVLATATDGAQTKPNIAKRNDGEAVASSLAAVSVRDRLAAIALLVPAEEPLRYPQPEIDAAMIQILELRGDEVWSRHAVANAWGALGARNRTEAFDRVADVFVRDAYDSLGTDKVLCALIKLCLSDPEHLRSKMRALLTPHLTATDKWFGDILMAFWILDLRESLPAIEALATSAPEDYEDGRASGHTREITLVKGRYHRARHIADLWNANDPVTEIRLLTAFALDNGYIFREGEGTIGRARFELCLRLAAKKLTGAQRAQLETFFQLAIEGVPSVRPGYISEADLSENEATAKMRRERVVSVVRASIAAN